MLHFEAKFQASSPYMWYNSAPEVSLANFYLLDFTSVIYAVDICNFNLVLSRWHMYINNFTSGM